MSLQEHCVSTCHKPAHHFIGMQTYLEAKKEGVGLLPLAVLQRSGEQAEEKGMFVNRKTC